MKWLGRLLAFLLLAGTAQAQTDSFLAANGTFKSPFALANTWAAAQTFNAAVSFNAGLTQALAQFHFFIGNGSGVSTDTALSGDCIYGAAGIVCTKTNGAAFVTVATSGSATDLGSGTLNAARLPAFGSADVSCATAGGACTIAANAVTNAKLAVAGAQNTVVGAATSTARADLPVPSCSTASSALTWTTNTGFGCNSIAAAASFTSGMVNGTIVQSQAGNAQTFALKTLAGNDPSVGDPITLLFRNSTAATGDYASVTLTSALSVTIPSTATLGTVNAQTNRIWLGVFNNAGTPVLGVYNAVSNPNGSPGTTSIVSWDESSPQSGTAITAGSTSAQTWYTASAVTTKALRVLGYIESTQATAGTWVTTPTKIQLYGPGISKPGTALQKVVVLQNTTDTTASATFVVFTHSEITITLQSAANGVILSCNGSGSLSVSNVYIVQWSRGTTANTNIIGTLITGNPSVTSSPTLPVGGITAFDFPNTASAQTYAIQAKTGGGMTFSYPAAGGSSDQLEAQEISS